MALVVAKSLSRLSRESLIDLCLKWTESTKSTPYLTLNRNLLESDEEDYLHEPAENIAALKELYTELKGQENGKISLSKKDIVDRIIDGDWRRGLSLKQLADIDFANLEQNDTALRWSALKLVPFKPSEESSSAHPAKKRKISRAPPPQQHYPTISPANFVANLKSHISPLVKAHYTLHRLPAPSNLVILRLSIVPNTPFAPVSSNIPRNMREATDSGRLMYIALPDSCPYVYISLSGSAGSALTSKSNDTKSHSAAKVDIAAIKRIVLESIPKAFSKPQERWSLENTKLTCRSLKAIGLLRGNTRPGTAGGCYSKFSEEYEWSPRMVEKTQVAAKSATTSTSSQVEPTPLTTCGSENHETQLDESDRTAQVTIRFGSMTQPSHAKMDRFHVTVTNIFTVPPTSKSKPVQSSTETSSVEGRPKRKRLSMEDIEAGRDQPAQTQSSSSSSSFSSTARTSIKTQEPAQISLTFGGTDVFQGLKELALLDGGRYVDLDQLPSWMTGEKGVSGLVV